MALTQIPINNEQFNETMDSRIKNEQIKQKYDKTVTAEIIDVTQAKQGKYFVKDENLTQYWVYSSNTDYQEGDQVYITIPQSDYAKDKIIVNKKLVNNSTDVKTRGNYLTNFIDFTGNLISSLNYNYNIEDKDQLRWLKTKTTTYLYTSVEVDIQALQDNLSNKDILKFKDQIGAKIIIKYNDNSSITLDFLINDFLGCLYNTRVLGNYEQYFLQEKVFSIKNLKPENIKGFEWQWVFSAYDLADKIRIKYRDPQIKIGCSKEEFDNEDRITLYTVEDFKDNKFYSGASNNNEKQTEATFFIEWLHLDENTNIIKNFKTIPSQNYKILWYKYAKNNLATKDDKYSTVNWPRNAGQLEEFINNYKSLYIKLNNALDKIIMDNSLTSQQDYNNFSTAVTNTYESDFKNQFQELISSMNNELNKVNQIADQDTLFNNNLFDGDNNFISQYIELITVEDDEERVVEKNNLINLYSNKINSYLNIPNNLFSMTVPLNVNLGATGARVVVLYCDQPLLSSIYTNEIILQNGDTSGLGRNEYGNPLTIVPSDGTSGIYNLYSLSGSLRNLDDATKIRELNVYYEGKKITDDEIIDIVWDIPNNNTMIKPLEEVLYDGQNRGDNNLVYYYNNNNNTNNWTALPSEGTTLKEKKEKTGLNIETLYIKMEEDKYVPIKYLSVPEYFTTESADDKFINKRVIKYTSTNNGIIAKPGEDFEYNATYKIENFYNENNHQLNCLYQINDFLNRALTNNYISVGVTFKDGSYCQGGIDLRFSNAGTNGSPFNFYLTVSDNNYPVLTLVDNENNIEEELIIEAHLEDTENGAGINLLQGTINPAITWKLNHNSESGGAEYVKITGENDSQLDVINNISSIKIKQNKNLSNAKSTLIMGNKTVLEATVEYGGYHLDTFLPIALRTDSSYKKLKGTTDLYYNSANGVQFNSEAFMPYELYKEIDNQGIITTEGIKYIINPNIQWETLLELPSKKENNEYDFEIYYSWNDQLELPNLNNNNLLQDNGNINNFSNISTQSSENSLLNDFEEKIINFIKNIFSSDNNNNHIIYGVSTISNDSNILSNLSTKIEPNCLLKLSNNLDLTLYINYIEGINFYYIKKDEEIEDFPDIIDGNNYNTIIESKKLEKEIEQDNYIEYTEEEQSSRYYYLYPFLTSSLKELKEYCDSYQKNSFNVFTQKNFNNNNNLSYVIYMNQGGLARFFPIPIKDEQEDTFYSYYWPKIELNDSLDQNILKLDNYYFVDYTNSKNYLNQYCVIAIDNQGNVLWSQPILQIRNLYPSAVVNNWNGKVEISEEQGTVMAPMIVAGAKNINNTFSGVILGAPQGDHDDSMSYTGIYGYGNGVQTYGFRADGTAFIGATSGGQINFNGNESVIQSGNYEVTYNEEGNRIVTGTKIDLDDGIIDSKYMTLKNNQMTLGESSLGQIQFNADKNSGTITSNNYTVSNGEKGIKIDLKNGTMILASDMKLEFQLPEYINYSDKITDFAFKLGIEIFNLGLTNIPDIGLKYIGIFRNSYLPNANESDIIGDSGYIDPADENILIKSIAQCLNYIIEDIFTNNSKYNELYKILSSSENNKFDENNKILNSYLSDNTDTDNNMKKQTIFILSLFNEKIQKGVIGAILNVSLDNIIIGSKTIEIQEEIEGRLTTNDIFIYANLKTSSTVYWLSLCAAACLLYMCKISPYSSDYTLNESGTDFSLDITPNDARMLQRLQISHGELQLVDEETEKFQYKTNFSPYGFYTTKTHYKTVVDSGQTSIQEDSKIIFDLLNTPSIMDTLYLNSILSINLNNPSICGTSEPTGEGQYAGQLYFRISE